MGRVQSGACFFLGGGAIPCDMQDLIPTQRSNPHALHWKCEVLTTLPPGKSQGLVLDNLTNLDSILKSRDITLPAKVRLVKAMVFLVVMYGYKSWTIKKVER